MCESVQQELGHTNNYVLVGNYHQKRTNFTTYARIRNTFQQSSHRQIEPKLQQIGIGSLKVLFML